MERVKLTDSNENWPHGDKGSMRGAMMGINNWEGLGRVYKEAISRAGRRKKNEQRVDEPTARRSIEMEEVE